MGRIFTVPPSPWEVDHAAAIVAGGRYVAQHGELPPGPLWAMLDRRDDLAPLRFARHHPNVALILDRLDVSRLEVPSLHAEIPSLRCEVQSLPAPATAALVTPEPCAASMLLTALAVGFALFGAVRLRRELIAVKTEAEPDGY